LGITILSVTSDFKDPKTNHLWSSIGFERTLEDGSTYSGKSVDWYAMTGNTKHELLSRYLASSNYAEPVQANGEHISITSISDTSANSSEQLLSNENSFTGVWRWLVDDVDSEVKNTKGSYLIL